VIGPSPIHPVFAEVPPRVEYRLPPLGERLRASVGALLAWGAELEASLGIRRDKGKPGRGAKPSKPGCST
jgi:DNA-binding HxlR family transcriptional regulator